VFEVETGLIIKETFKVEPYQDQRFALEAGPRFWLGILDGIGRE
jgi:hypothetical protein